MYLQKTWHWTGSAAGTHTTPPDKRSKLSHSELHLITLLAGGRKLS